MEELNRKALASLPMTRQFKTSHLVSKDLFATITFDQIWYTYAKGSDLYPQKFIGNEYGYLDLWEIKPTGLRHIEKMAVGNMIPAWNRATAFFVAPKSRPGAVLISEPPSASVPLIELVRIRVRPPFFTSLYKGLGSFTAAKASTDSVTVHFKQLTVNRKEFGNLKKRFIVSSRAVTARF